MQLALGRHLLAFFSEGIRERGQADVAIERSSLAPREAETDSPVPGGVAACRDKDLMHALHISCASCLVCPVALKALAALRKRPRRRRVIDGCADFHELGLRRRQGRFRMLELLLLDQALVSRCYESLCLNVLAWEAAEEDS